MVQYLWFPITFDPLLFCHKDDPQFIQKITEVAEKMKWNPNRSRGFSYNGTRMRMHYTLKGELHVTREE